MEKQTASIPFTAYQKFAVFILAITQFTVILDFMVMSPLGDILMKSLDLKPAPFGLVVSAYAFSAGISGLLTAGFADKFDRKKLLLFFYIGFIIGTILCGIVNSYPLLLAARIVTGLFGGVIGSISMAIVADLFSLQQRGRVMGFVQMGFGASQILGIPIGLYLANAWGWHAPFLWVAGMAGIVAVAIAVKLKPITKHLEVQRDKSAFLHLIHTLAKKDYRIGFTATALLSIGGFMMMPFGSAFAINNLKITEHQLPMMFMVAGLSTLIIMPLVGKLSDKIDKYKIFAFASIWTMIMVGVYTNLGVTPFYLVLVFNVLMMAGIMSRIVPSTALVTSIPDVQDRGAFMSINSSLQQIAGGIAAAFAGTIVVQKNKLSPLEHYDTLGIIIIFVLILSIILMYRVDRLVKKKAK
ncbi:Predicted arabinose efflux permease, MFS family [Flavobacterium fluvii]|uniref:Predicted arabinose efflux permease, MFS family n=1 Tax=Flavobacterium fluvii TaxID=468056 RepID=A0A1M5L5R0_9FLAO|nr:MFS transporter [Flavobacterium fluvii]SHG60331.1 Predicted arabinose efflux permease, MFS family [Flavobacterium fluvii]